MEFNWIPVLRSSISGSRVNNLASFSKIFGSLTAALVAIFLEPALVVWLDCLLKPAFLVLFRFLGVWSLKSGVRATI